MWRRVLVSGRLGRDAVSIRMWTSLIQSIRVWNLITVQQDATYSVYYISVGSSTCFGC